MLTVEKFSPQLSHYMREEGACLAVHMNVLKVNSSLTMINHIVQELCESRGGRPELAVLTSLLVSVDVTNY